MEPDSSPGTPPQGTPSQGTPSRGMAPHDAPWRDTPPRGMAPRNAASRDTPPRPVDRLPDWIRSIRFRYTVLYSAVLFGLAALLVGSMYVGISARISSGEAESFEGQISVRVNGEEQLMNVEVLDYAELQRRLNSNTLEQLRDFSFIALAVLFVTSLGVGWMVAGRVLAPIARITDVARDIQATDLKRRIRMQGPDDELKQLSDTFDGMLGRLDAAFDAQQQFVADASHELRNPLAVIRTNLDVALSDRGATAEDLRETAGVVKRASDRMASLVDDLLLVARRQVPGRHREVVLLEAVIGEEIDEFAAPAREKGVTLAKEVTAGLSVVGDRDALRRLLANLLENAIRHSSRGGEVHVTSGRETGGEWVTVAVTDQGPGIAQEHQKRIFDRFWRVDRSRSRAGGGTGLGLSIARQIAHAHGGDLHVRSEPGKGSTFTVRLPLAVIRDQPAPMTGAGHATA